MDVEDLSAENSFSNETDIEDGEHYSYSKYSYYWLFSDLSNNNALVISLAMPHVVVLMQVLCHLSGSYDLYSG